MARVAIHERESLKLFEDDIEMIKKKNYYNDYQKKNLKI